ncbi:putative peptidoglycan lipid II flippase [Pullulanibacillus pueri]|uniref:Lipid II flippase n=1 Tax=Pullulanibacillus pueri TaxID=1437324 RepID=A0A8J2ZTL5_9BACL|nr:murein biosynthesis integral membrane protein MurJ [Pullulanibacillus pueri]MBM7681889.1 putative peptidoglycan lipid II flippase [Pullulanibacillus pueri]GGH76480.1 putative lipid II flippase MurJ [Pullulanibacillus pueri]
MSSKTSKLITIIGGVAVLNLLSRLLGFVRDMVIGYQFGTHALADAIFAAYSLPYFLYVVLGGALTTAFISIYNKIEDPLVQKSFRQQILLGTGLLTIIVSLIFASASKPVTAMVFHGMSDQENLVIAHLLALMAPSVFFMVFSMVLSGILNVHGYYKLTAFATMVMNAFLVIVGLLFAHLWGAEAHSVAVVVGGAAMFIIVSIQLKRKGLLGIGWGTGTHTHMKSFFKVFVPILLGGATLQFYTLIQRIFASGLPEGSISSLNYAMKLVQLPQGVVMGAVTTVVFPKLVEVVAKNDQMKMQEYYIRGLRWLTLGIVPVSFFVLIFAEDLIRVVFQHGMFSQSSTHLTATVLQIIALSMLFNAANVYITRFYYAYEHSISPVIFNLLSIFVINVGVTEVTMHWLGVYGIALGTMISTLVNFILLIWRIRPTLEVTPFAFIGLKECGFLVFFGILLLGYRRFLLLQGSPYLNITLECLYFLVVGLMLALLFKLPEMDRVKRYFVKK